MLPGLNLGQIDKKVTIFASYPHLRRCDYIDEEADDSVERLKALYDRHPCHLWEGLNTICS